MLKIERSTLQKSLLPLMICLLGYVSNYVLSIVLAHALNQEQFGIVTYAILINSLLAVFIAFGTDTNSKHFLTLYLKEKAFNRLRLYISWNIEVFSKPVIITFTLFSIMFFFIDPFTFIFDHQLTNFQKILTTILFTAPFYAATNILCTYLLCDSNVRLYTYFYYLQTNFLMVLLTLAAIYTDLLESSLSLILMLFVLVNIFNVISCLIATRIKSPIIYDCFKNQYHKNKLISKMHTWNKGARAQLYTNFSLKAMLKIDFIIMIFFAQSHSELGIYGIAMNTAIILIFFPLGIFQHIIPSVSNIVKSKSDKKKVQALWNQSLILNTVMIFICAFCLHHYAENIILLFYGPKYIEAVPLVKIMCVTYIFSSTGGIKSALLNYTGNTRYSNYTYFARIILCIVLAYFFKDYGMIGVAYASLISEFARNLASTLLIRHKLNFKTLGVF